MKRLIAAASALTLFAPVVACKTRSYHGEDSAGNAVEETRSCDVIVAGGTTAGLAAALSAARAFKDAKAKKHVCLVEPTDWPGGQLTSSGVSAVDFAHHALKVPGQDDMRFDTGILGRRADNQARLFRAWMEAAPFAKAEASGEFGWGGNPGGCWVSVRCYLPTDLLASIDAAVRANVTHLTVLRSTVVRGVDVDASGRVTSLLAVARSPLPLDPRTHPRGEWSVPLSRKIADWYAPGNSKMFTKRLLRLKPATGLPVVVDATEWGEVLVTSGADYTQGVELDADESPARRDESCGQAIVFPLAIEAREKAVTPGGPGLPAEVEALTAPHPSHYGLAGSSLEHIWTYRRIRKGQTRLSADTTQKEIRAGDISNQNWVAGNDYPYRYLFKGVAAARKEAGLDSALKATLPNSWTGGVDAKALADAEAHALGWFKHLRAQPHPSARHFALSEVLGTSNGLSKVPYIRDTRRSIGAEGFFLRYNGPDGIFEGKDWGEETVALGVYEADIHLTKCAAPPPHLPSSGSDAAKPKPFFIPFRALTNRTRPNLLVAGKTMAHSFLANAAMRLHPIEFSTGVAAGIAAAVSLAGGGGAKAQAQPDFHVMAKDPSLVRAVRVVLTAKGQDGAPAHAPLGWTGLEKAVRAKRPSE